MVFSYSDHVFLLPLYPSWLLCSISLFPMAQIVLDSYVLGNDVGGTW